MWNKYAFKLPLVKKKADLNASFETRFREDIDEFYRYQFYMGPDYHLYPWLTLGWQRTATSRRGSRGVPDRAPLHACL